MIIFTKIIITLSLISIIFGLGYIAGAKRKDEERGIHKHWWEY